MKDPRRPPFTNPTRSLVLEEIIRVAAACFGKVGYRATTLETIAAKVGISEVTLYRYVSSKEELLGLVFERAVEAARHGLRQIIDQPAPADEKLRRIVRHQVRLVTRDLSFAAVFFGEESGLASGTAKRVAVAKREYDRAIGAAVQEGIDRGVLRDLPPTLVTFAILGMCNWLHKWYRPGGKLTPDQIGDVFVDLLERGYLKCSEDRSTDSVLLTRERIEARLASLERRVDDAPRRRSRRVGPRR